MCRCNYVFLTQNAIIAIIVLYYCGVLINMGRDVRKANLMSTSLRGRNKDARQKVVVRSGCAQNRPGYILSVISNQG